MSRDLFLGKTKHDWSREIAATDALDLSLASVPPAPDPAKVAALTTKLKAIKAASDKGDARAQKKWAKINKRVAKLHLSASRGSFGAAKKLAALNATGLFVTTVDSKSMKTVMHGSFVGKDEILGTFVGEGSVTCIKGDDRLTEIVSSGSFVGALAAEIMGSDDNLGDESLATKAALAPLRAVKAAADLPVKAAELAMRKLPGGNNALAKASLLPFKAVAAVAALPVKAAEKLLHRNPEDEAVDSAYQRVGKDEILGDDSLTEIITSGAFVGEEELALAREGGASERAALHRRFSSSGRDEILGGDDVTSDPGMPAKDEQARLASIKERANNGNPEAAKKWAEACARVKKIKDSAKSGNKADQARLARIHEMNLFPGTALMYETL